MFRLRARVTAAVAACLPVLLVAACARSSPTGFSVANARTHVEMLGRTIGIRPVGTEGDGRAREYIVAELTRSGFQVHVQEADAKRPELGLTARVSNVVGVLPGDVPDALALVAHYDSTPDGPGAADDGLGVAVSLEAGRVLAGRSGRQHTVIVALTDAEEIGLMGAAALVDDPAWKPVGAYLNFEAVGTSGPSALFETGPGNTWLVDAWASRARSPFGGSFAIEIYKRLSNDTDFTILKRSGIPGLNFAPIGNSYAYHTLLDTPDRLSDDTIRTTGDTAVAIADALDDQDVRRRSSDGTLFFDIGGLSAITTGSWAVAGLAGLGLLAGAAAWVRMFLAARRVASLGRLLATALWGLAAFASTFTSMFAAAWGLRAAREVYHPWYAHPDRFFVLIVSAGVCGWLGIGRLAAIVPARVRPHRHPAIAWCGVLPVWLALAVLAVRLAPAASYLVTLPLAAAGLALLPIRAGRPLAIRMASLVPLVVAWLIWARLTNEFMHFLVPMFGRLPVITPLVAYPALLVAAGLFVVAPALALVAGLQPRWAPRGTVTAAALLTVAISGSLAYMAPAYSVERPLHRYARYIQDFSTNAAYWEIGGNEPGLDLERDGAAPHDWSRVTNAAPVSVSVDRAGGPFRFRAQAEANLAQTADVSGSLEQLPAEVRLEITVRLREPGGSVVLFMPPRVKPLRANFPGVVWSGRWRAAYAGPTPSGVTFRVTLRAEDRASVAGCRVAVLTPGLPGGTGLLRLPAWLPEDRVAWNARTVSIHRVGIAP